MLKDQAIYRCLTLLASTCLLASKSFALQQQQQPTETEIFVDVDAVNLLVSVTNKQGRSVTDLKLENFRILEDGQAQTITNFGIEKKLPLSIAVLIDTSASVRTKLDFEKQAATNFVFSVMQPRDQTMVAEFDTGVTLVTDFTNQPTEIARQLKGLQAGGGTALLDAVFIVARDKLNIPERRNTVIVISDGADLDSTHSAEEALDLVQKNNITVYAIGTNRIGASGDQRGEKILEELAQRTGGRAFFPYSAEQLHHAFNLIDEELRSLYSLTYTPTRKARDGKYRKVKVKLVKAKKLVVRHRKGYYGPSETS